MASRTLAALLLPSISAASACAADPLYDHGAGEDPLVGSWRAIAWAVDGQDYYTFYENHDAYPSIPDHGWEEVHLDVVRATSGYLTWGYPNPGFYNYMILTTERANVEATGERTYSISSVLDGVGLSIDCRRAGDQLGCAGADDDGHSQSFTFLRRTPPG